jgi:hypothetical protein
VIGAFLNALGMLAGALLGLIRRAPLTARTQDFFKAALGCCTVIYGLRLAYDNIHRPFAFPACLRQVTVVMLAIFLGYWIGRLLRLQVWSNRLGHHAAEVLAAAQKHPPGPALDGLLAATALFCAAPLGILGAVADGLQNYCYLLLLKAVMDGLAMMSLVKTFRWPVALAALPVFCFFNGLALGVHLGPGSWLDTPGQQAVAIADGLITCAVALVIFQIRRVELANYLPALAVAPLLTHWLG